MLSTRPASLSPDGVLGDLGGPRTPTTASALLVEPADEYGLAEHRRLRHHHFVERQGLFDDSDIDEVDLDQNSIVLVARDHSAPARPIVGGVRVHPVGDPTDGHWVGSRLVTSAGARLGVGASLVRAACSHVAAEGAIRFDAVVQADKESFFRRLGWRRVTAVRHRGADHVRMSWPTGTFMRASTHKAAIGRLVGELAPGGAGWVGDDGCPVPGTDVVVVTDAILPAMVERDPWWAGWCSVLVNANDLAAMGATAIGLMDTVAAPTESLARRVIDGMNAASATWGIPVLGGHTQLGVHSSLSVTMIGCTDQPVPGGAARAGDRLSVVADLAGGWRAGYAGRQWDSTSVRDPDVLRSLHALIGDLPLSSAKDVSMAGLVGTVGMLAEASGLAAHIDVDRVPRPRSARAADWLTCFPGYAMVVAHRDDLDIDRRRFDDDVVVAEIGRFAQGCGIDLRWPDGHVETVIDGPVTGLGTADAAQRARREEPPWPS